VPEAFRVSVVIPAFNEASRIGAAIAAIRGQTEPPAEIVVVDDGSKDGTAAIARQLGAIVIVQSNGGISAARNAGIREGAGPWLAFCDADDVWHPEMLKRARLAHEARPAVGFIFADHCVDVDGRVTLPSMFGAAPQFRATASEVVAPNVLFFQRDALAHALARRNFAAPSTVVVRRELILERELFFDEHLPSNAELHVAEDIEWYLRVLTASDALAIDRVMLTYHRHAGSVSENPGRVNYGNVRLGELIAASPDRYAPGLARTYATERRRHLRVAAGDDLRTLRFRSARSKFREAQRIAFRPADGALVFVTLVAEFPGGIWIADVVRRTWRAFLRPAIRALGRRAR
jgi:glycosyltransferase involved in cell wall biosynthesis